MKMKAFIIVLISPVVTKRHQKYATLCCPLLNSLLTWISGAPSCHLLSLARWSHPWLSTFASRSMLCVSNGIWVHFIPLLDFFFLLHLTYVCFYGPYFVITLRGSGQSKWYERNAASGYRSATTYCGHEGNNLWILIFWLHMKYTHAR